MSQMASTFKVLQAPFGSNSSPLRSLIKSILRFSKTSQIEKGLLHLLSTHVLVAAIHPCLNIANTREGALCINSLALVKALCSAIRRL